MTTVSLLCTRTKRPCLLPQALLFTLYLIQSVEGQFYDSRFNQFDWDLIKAVGNGVNENVLVSPISVKLVLAMLYEGANGNTSSQIEQVLNIHGEDKGVISSHFFYILRSLQKESSDYDLDVGTKLFLDKKKYLNEDYNDKLKRYYDASVEQIDFSQSAKTVSIINNWAEEATKGHIKNLLSEADVNESTILLLLNAVYFKGKWHQIFPKNQTTKGLFYVKYNHVVPVEYMNCVQTQKYSESEDLDATLLRLPYMGNKFAMYIILPNEVDGLDTIVNNLNEDEINEMIKRMDNVEVNISLPKFDFHFESSLKPTLQKLGLKDMFNENANLSDITVTKENLVVSNVIQKAGIRINEQGSTAYAATELDLVSKFGEHQVKYYVNRPFLFFIKDEASNTTVFVGKVINPGSTSLKPVVEKVESVPVRKPMISQPPHNPVNQQSTGNRPMGSVASQFGAQPQHGFTNQGNTPTPDNAYQGFINEAGNHKNVSKPNGNWINGPGGIIEHSSNIDQTSNQPSIKPTYPSFTPAAEGSRYPSNSEFYSDFKPKFDIERFTFFDTELQQTISGAEQQNNWVISPASVKTVLGMIYEGAAGATEMDLARLLRLPFNKTSSLRTLHSIQRELFTDPGRGVRWVMANKLISSAKLPLTHEYMQAMGSMYRASVDLSKFESPASVAGDINNWINNVTNGFIPTLVNSDSISKDSQLVLLNAVYFKGDWQYPFSKKFSQRECFYPEPNKCKEINMMTQRAYVKYGFYQQLYAHIIELPYANSRFSMVLLVPEIQGGLPDVLKNLAFCPILPFLKTIGPSEVQLSLPSFSVEYSNDLTNALTKMGAKSIFSDDADLRYMLGRGKAKISKIIHKAKIVVNEKGTEGGAGTAGVIVPLMNSQVIQLTINHPFLFYLRDLRSGFIFMGQIIDPSQK